MRQQSWKESERSQIKSLATDYVVCAERRPYEDGQIWCTDDLLPEGVTWAAIPEKHRHVIVCGNVPDLYHFILPLRSRKSNNIDKDGLITIVVINPVEISHSDWHRLSIFPQIYFIKGSPLYREDLLRAGVPHAQHVVVFPPPKRPHNEGVIGSTSKTQMETEAMADADTLFINSALHSINPHVHVISELVHFSNMPYLNAIHAGNLSQKPPSPTSLASPINHQASAANLTGGGAGSGGAGEGRHMIPPWFAAGNVYISSLNDFLSAQLFHNPMLVTLLEKIIVGGRINHDAYEKPGVRSAVAVAPAKPKPKPKADDSKRKENKVPAVHDDNNTMIELVSPFELELQNSMRNSSKSRNDLDEDSMRYKDIFFCFNKLKAIPIAILRGPSSPEDHFDFGNKLNYVYTNPPPETVVRKQDKIFLLVSSKDSWLMHLKNSLRRASNGKSKSSASGSSGTSGKKGTPMTLGNHKNMLKKAVSQATSTGLEDAGKVAKLTEELRQVLSAVDQIHETG